MNTAKRGRGPLGFFWAYDSLTAAAPGCRGRTSDEVLLCLDVPAGEVVVGSDL